MFFSIDPTNGVPVYEQVARQIVFAVASGGLVVGEMIPSVRVMARELAINPEHCGAGFSPASGPGRDRNRPRLGHDGGQGGQVQMQVRTSASDSRTDWASAN